MSGACAKLTGMIACVFWVVARMFKLGLKGVVDLNFFFFFSVKQKIFKEYFSYFCAYNARQPFIGACCVKSHDMQEPMRFDATF